MMAWNRTLWHTQSTDSDAIFLAPYIGEKDLEECEAMGHSPLEALRLGLDGFCLTARSDRREIGDDRIGMLGVSDSGVVWSLWRDDLTTHECLQIARLTRTYMTILRAHSSFAGRLYNWALSDNKRALGWLRFSGLFQFGEPQDFKGDGRRWTPFYMVEEGPDVRPS